MVRRTKEDVAAALPPKVHSTSRLALSAAEDAQLQEKMARLERVRALSGGGVAPFGELCPGCKGCPHAVPPALHSNPWTNTCAHGPSATHA